MAQENEAYRTEWNLRHPGEGDLPVGYRGEGGGSSVGSTPDLAALAREQLKMRQEANAPAVASLEASIPETANKFATERTRLSGEKEPLKQRYQNLLDEITRREKVDISGQERVTSREFGRRGIPLSSGLFDVTLQEQLSPLRQFYTGQTKEAGLGREEGLRGIENLIAQLTGQETEQQRSIRNAIAQLQSGAGQEAISGAMNMYQLQQQAQQRNAELAFQQQQAERSNQLAREQFEFSKQGAGGDKYATIGEGSTLFDLLAGRPVYTAPKTYKPSDQFGVWE